LTLVVAIVLGAPAVIIGLAVAAYPFLVVPALIAATVVWIGSLVVGWLLIQIRDLRAQVAGLRDQAPATQPAPTDSRMWEEVETIELYVEEGMWKPTSLHRFREGAKLRVTAKGSRRFVAHLATDIDDNESPRKRKFASVERAAETKNLRRFFTIPKDGQYAFVFEPRGLSTLVITVHVEVEYVPGAVSFDW
jgi:hypothetical protein